MNKTQSIAIAAALLFSSTAWAGTLTVPNTFTSGTPAVAAQVNANFAAAKTAVDDNNTRINTNAATAATNATNITANTTSITSDNVRINTNAATAATNATDIAANSTSITALQSAKPGYATAFGAVAAGTATTLTGTGQAVVTLTMNAPASGFAIVTGRAYATLNHVLNTRSAVLIKVSTTSGDVVEDFDASFAVVIAAKPTGALGQFIAVTSVIPVVAGANIIYLNAHDPIGSVTPHFLAHSKLTAVYVPNAY